MKVSDYDYTLPSCLIAQFPPKQRTTSRLLKLAADGELQDLQLTDMVGQLKSGDLLVLNNTKVIPARLFGCKDTGGKVEILLERILSENRISAQIRCNRSPKLGQSLVIDDAPETKTTVLERKDGFFELEIITKEPLRQWFERIGHMPLPPYIEREDQPQDADRYQTVFAEHHGAVAAPTAGLHYDESLLRKIESKGVQIETITLHVGAGTYQPVRVVNLKEHKMHSELLEVSEAVCKAILETKQRGGRVAAVGTTVVRALESAAQASSNGLIEKHIGETNLFIYPGFEFKVVDVLQTNFHLPQSTLLMMVSAFAGYQPIKLAYQHAIKQQYRFFSYGDAMLLEHNVAGMQG